MKEIILGNDDIIVNIDGITLNKSQLKTILKENVVLKRQLDFVQNEISAICGGSNE